jgi:HSP20 family protein
MLTMAARPANVVSGEAGLQRRIGMSLVRWDPMRDLQVMRDRLNQVFEDAIVRPGSNLLADLAERPAMDIYERDGNFIVEAHIPGFTPDEVEVSLSNRTLTISAKHEETKEVKEKTYYRRESHAGTLLRSIVLPDDVDVANLDAALVDGVLTLTAKKLEVTPTTKIAVRPALKEAAVG